MAKEVINVRLPEGVNIEQIDAKAESYGLSRSAYITKAIELFLDLDPLSLMKIQNYSNRVDAPVGVVMQNTVIKELARQAAKADVWGPAAELKLEFVNDRGKYVVGDDLFFTLYNDYKDKFTQDKIKQLLEDEIYGLLNDDDKAFLIQHRAGKTWLESEEYKDELALRQKLEQHKKQSKGSSKKGE